MRWGLVAVGLLASHLAAADAFDDCKQRRRELTAEALKIGDIGRRGVLLAAMPICRRLGDGNVAVELPPPPYVEDDSPFSPRFVLGVSTGGAAAYVTGREDPHIGYGAMLELELGVRPWRAVSLAGYARFTRIDSNGVLVSRGEIETPVGPVDAMSKVAVVERLYEVGGRVRRHFGGLSLGADVGIAIENGIDFQETPTRYVLLALGCSQWD